MAGEPPSPADAPPSGGSRDQQLQAAVEQFVDLHQGGAAPAPEEFAAGFAAALRPALLARLRGFLCFDEHVGPAPFAAAPAAAAARRLGDFEIEAELGRGGMGVVYLARQVSLQRRVALKVLQSGLSLSRRHVERFRREAAAAAQLRHPAIVAVHGFAEVGDTLAFAMDYVAGRNLADLLDDLRLAHGDAPGPVEGSFGLAPGKGYVAECAVLCAQLASALAAAHQAGIVHRDLKPRNVMIDERRQVRLLDFGLAKSLGEGSLSLSGEITGTAHYMSPEQTLAKRVAVDHRCDVWALGVILYELLTLRRPFDGRNLQQVVYAICFQEPRPIAQWNPKVPRDLVTICQKALEKDPQNRYASAAEFEQDLLRFLRFEPIHARPAGLASRAAKWLHRHRTESLGLAALLLLLAALLGWRVAEARAAADYADAQLTAAAAAAARGDFAAAEQLATLAIARRDDAAGRAQLELHREQRLRAATQTQTDLAQAALWVQHSLQAMDRDRELALQLALAAAARWPGADTRSAVLQALGPGFAARSLTGGHQGQVLSARWSPDGTAVATAGADGAIGVWDAAAGTLRTTLRGHGPWVVDAVFCGGGEQLLSAGTDRTLRRWQAATGQQLLVADLPFLAAALRPDRLGARALVTGYAAQGGPFLAQVFDAASGQPLGAPHRHPEHVVAAALSPCGRYAATWGGDPGHVPLWDAATGALLARLAGHGARVRALAFAPDSRRLATAGMDGAVRVFAVPDGALLATGWHSRPVDALGFAPGGERLLSGSRDQTARLWQLPADGAGQRLHELRTFVGHGGDLLQVAFDGSGQLCATACRDGVLRLFDGSDGRGSTGSELLRLEVGPSLDDAAFDPEGRRLLALANRQRPLVWQFGAAAGFATLRQPGAVPAAAFDAAGESIVTAGDDERLRRWDARDGRLLWTGALLGNPVLTLDVDARGERIAASTVDGGLHVHRLRDGEPLFRLPAQKGRVPVLRWSQDGRRLLSAGSDGTAVVWNADDRTAALVLTRPAGLVAADLSADGGLLATVDRDSDEILLWAVPDGAARGSARLHRGPATWVRFHPDGQQLAAVGRGGTVARFRLDGGLAWWADAGVPLQHVAWSADGAQLLTCAAGPHHEAQLWQCQSGALLLRHRSHRNIVEWGAFAPDGQSVLTCSRDGTTRRWPTDPEAAARRLPLRALTTAERQRYGLPQDLPR